MPARNGTRARLDAYARGIVYGMHLAVAGLELIAATVAKTDGTHPCQQTVSDCIALCEANGGVAWGGGAGAVAASGQPRDTTQAFDKALLKLVFKHRSSAKVTVGIVKKRLLKARRYSNTLVERRLGEVGLQWLHQRRKSLVPTKHKPGRMSWADWVLRRTALTLSRWAYTDGTVDCGRRCARRVRGRVRGAASRVGRYRFSP